MVYELESVHFNPKIVMQSISQYFFLIRSYSLNKLTVIKIIRPLKKKAFRKEKEIFIITAIFHIL